jgi:hypothetical protein
MATITETLPPIARTRSVPAPRRLSAGDDFHPRAASGGPCLCPAPLDPPLGGRGAAITMPAVLDHGRPGPRVLVLSQAPHVPTGLPHPAHVVSIP